MNEWMNENCEINPRLVNQQWLVCIILELSSNLSNIFIKLEPESDKDVLWYRTVQIWNWSGIDSFSGHIEQFLIARYLKEGIV